MGSVLRELGYAVSIEVSPSGGRMRLRATLPMADGRWKQQRITTSLEFPGDLQGARKLAEELVRDVDLHRRGLEPFPDHRWFGAASGQGVETNQTISGIEAIQRTELWWGQQRKRGVSAAVSWATDYAAPLKDFGENSQSLTEGWPSGAPPPQSRFVADPAEGGGAGSDEQLG